MASSGIEASPPTRTNGRLPTNPRSIHVCGRPFVCVEGWALAPNAAHGRERFFDCTGAGNSTGVGGELRVLLVFFSRTAALTLRPCPPRFQADSAAVLRGCWPRKGRSPRYGCRSRLWKVSSVFLLCSSVVMPRSRPVRALPFPFSPTQQYRGPQDGSSPAASRPRYGRRSSLRAKVSLFDWCVFYSTLLTPRLCTFHPTPTQQQR